MTSQEPYTQPLADPDLPDTEVILVEQPAPVFVDSTGRRRRLLRRFSYAFGAFCMVYGGLISVSLAGGPVSPNAVLPFPDLIDGSTGNAAEMRPTPTPAPAVSAPRAVLVNENLSRRPSGARENGTREHGIAGTRSEPRPSRSTGPSLSASPRPSASATPTRTRPVESTMVPSAAPSTTTPVPTGTPTTLPTGTGGTGGGSGTGEGVVDETPDTGGATGDGSDDDGPGECPEVVDEPDREASVVNVVRDTIDAAGSPGTSGEAAR